AFLFGGGSHLPPPTVVNVALGGNRTGDQQNKHHELAGGKSSQLQESHRLWSWNTGLYGRQHYISFICRGWTVAMRTRSTRRSVDSSTSKRKPSSSMTSPFCGIRPASSLTSPATVAASLPSGRMPKSSSR